MMGGEQKQQQKLVQQAGQRLEQARKIQSSDDFEKNLHRQFVKLGNDRRKLTNQLLALLPDIFQKKIYKKYAGSIFEYAAKFGGLSESVVKKRLRLEKYVYDKPMLKDAIRTEGINKVALLASLATKENEGLIVDKLKNMSKPAIQELSKELRAKQEEENQAGGLFGKSKQDPESFCRAIPIKINLELDEGMSTAFLKLKKIYGENLSNREVMKKMMEELLELKTKKNKSDSKLVQKSQSEKVVPGDNFSEQASSSEPIQKSQFIKPIPGDNSQNVTNFSKADKNPKLLKSNPANSAKPVARYISAPIKRKTLQSTDGKCSYPGCNKPADNIHHSNPFSESKNHDSLKPLCKIHHEFMHNGLVSNQTDDPERWQLSLEADLSFVDYQYRRCRKR